MFVNKVRAPIASIPSDCALTPAGNAYGNSATCSSPAVSGKPSIRFMFLIALAAQSAHRLRNFGEVAVEASRKCLASADRATVQVARLTGLPRLEIRIVLSCFHCCSLLFRQCRRRGRYASIVTHCLFGKVCGEGGTAPRRSPLSGRSPFIDNQPQSNHAGVPNRLRTNM